MSASVGNGWRIKLNKWGRRTRGSWSLRGGSGVAFFALTLGLLAACAQLSGTPANQEVAKGPDIMDRVRSLDLLPRFPRQPDAASQNAGAGLIDAVEQIFDGGGGG